MTKEQVRYERLLSRNISEDFKGGVFSLETLGNKYGLGTDMVIHFLHKGGINKRDFIAYLVRDEVEEMMMIPCSASKVAENCSRSHRLHINSNHVHYCMRKFGIEKKNNVSDIMKMKREGVKQSDIARYLGVSRQFVSKIVLKGVNHEN